MGISLGRGSFKFVAGVQHRIQIRIKMNTVSGGSSSTRNGILQISLDGKTVINRNDMLFRKNPTVTTSALFFCAFFGGSGSQWASPIDQSIYFNNFSIRSNQ
jgi:hypothetical protein